MGIGKAFFIVENNKRSGWGHLARCIELAEDLYTRDIISVFLNIGFEAQQKFSQRLKKFSLEVCANEKKFRCLLSNDTPFILILDGYSFDKEFFLYLRQLRVNTFLISDTPDISPLVTGIIDPNYRRKPLTTANNYFYGVNQIPINREARVYSGLQRKVLAGEKSPCMKIAVAISVAADPLGELERQIIHILASLNTKQISVDIFGARGRYNIQRKNEGRTLKVRRVRNINMFFRSISAANLSILSMGRLMYESLFIGTPVVAIALSERHQAFKREIQRTGAVLVIDAKKVEQSLMDFFRQETLHDVLAAMQTSSTEIFKKNTNQQYFSDFITDYFKKKRKR